MRTAPAFVVRHGLLYALAPWVQLKPFASVRWPLVLTAPFATPVGETEWGPRLRIRSVPTKLG